MTLGPFDLHGGAFLALYAGLLLVAIGAAVAIPRWLRPDGRSVRSRDADELAYLAGGRTRFVDALVARLLAAGAVAMEGKHRFRIARAGPAGSEAERGVLRLSSPASWSAVNLAALRGVPVVEANLVRSGLLIEGATAAQLRLWQTMPFLLLLAFGATKWEIGRMRDRPVGYLTALLAVTAVFALIRFLALDRRTRGGVEALQAARASSERLRRAPVADETGTAVALFGTGVLSGSAWSDYHAMRSAGGSDGGSSGSDGSSGCGGGGGGGGCGGCGS